MQNLTTLLTQYNIYQNAKEEIDSEVIAMMHSYIEDLHKSGEYDQLAKNVLSFKLSVRIFDVFGESLDNGLVHSLFTASDSDLDRQLRAADARLGAYGFPYKYGRKYADLENPSQYKVDCILFAADDDCVSLLYRSKIATTTPAANSAQPNSVNSRIVACIQSSWKMSAPMLPIIVKKSATAL